MSRTGWLFVLASLLATFSSVMAWQREPSSAAVASFDGSALFQAKGCSTCHNGPDSSALTGAAFPSLADASGWADERRPDLTAVEYLSESIREPWAFLSLEFSPGGGGPTTAMPALALTDAEVDAIVEYLLAG